MRVPLAFHRANRFRFPNRLGMAAAVVVGLVMVFAAPAAAVPFQPPAPPPSAPPSAGKPAGPPAPSVPRRRLADSPRGGVHVNQARRNNVRSTAPRAGTTVDGSVPPLLPGSPVQHSIRVYVIYWGSSWNCTTGANCANQQRIRTDVSTLFNGLSNSSYQRILHQYYDGAGHISDQMTFAGTAVDTSSVPSTIGQKGTSGDIPAEVDRMVTANGWTNSADTQFIVVSTPGTTVVLPDGTGNGSFCAYHGYDSANGTGAQTYVYSMIPYLPDI